MNAFDPQTYGPELAGVINLQRLGELGTGCPNASLRARLAALTLESAFAPHPIKDQQMADCCLAGLWLANDFLDESHAICQDIDTTTGSYWHGIMHRREPDFSNSKYWFRRVGDHPVFQPLASAAREIVAAVQVTGPAAYLTKLSEWEPFRFVDLCESVYHGDVSNQGVCRQIAAAEWQLLFDYGYRKAC